MSIMSSVVENARPVPVLPKNGPSNVIVEVEVPIPILSILYQNLSLSALM